MLTMLLSNALFHVRFFFSNNITFGNNGVAINEKYIEIMFEI